MKRFLICTLAVLFLSSALRSQEPDADSPTFKKNSVGVGLGIPYGIIGANVDVNVLPNLNASAGLGTTVMAGVGYNFGLKYFFTDLGRAFRPRVSAFYGINAATEITKIYIGAGGSSSTETQTYTGLSLGIGGQWMWGESKSFGLDFDVIWMATTGLDINKLRNQGYSFVEEPGKVKISLGFRYAI